MKIFEKIKTYRKIYISLIIFICLLFGMLFVFVCTKTEEKARYRSIEYLLEDYFEAYIDRDLNKLAGTFYKTNTSDFYRFIEENNDLFDTYPITLAKSTRVSIINSVSLDSNYEASVDVRLVFPDSNNYISNTFTLPIIKRSLKFYLSEKAIGKPCPSELYGSVLTDESLKAQITIQDKSIETYSVNSGDIISYNTFMNCKRLSTVFLPSTLNHIDADWFRDCDVLTRVIIDKKSPYLKSVDGIVYSKKGDVLIYYPKGKIQNTTSSNLGVFIIPPTVKEIAVGAFAHCIALNSVTFPPNLHSIHRSAFNNCVNLEKVLLNDGLANIYLESFYDCTKLLEISIPSTVRHIGNECFYNNTRLSSVSFAEDSQLSYLGYSAFEKCFNLERVTLPNNINTINDWVFQDCYNLKEINLPVNLASIGIYSFRNCQNLESLFISKKVNFIGRGAFANCKKLQLSLECENNSKLWDKQWNLGFY